MTAPHQRPSPHAPPPPHCLRRRSHSPSTKSLLELGFGSNRREIEALLLRSALPVCRLSLSLRPSDVRALSLSLRLSLSLISDSVFGGRGNGGGGGGDPGIRGQGRGQGLKKIRGRGRGNGEISGAGAGAASPVISIKAQYRNDQGHLLLILENKNARVPLDSIQAVILPPSHLKLELSLVPEAIPPNSQVTGVRPMSLVEMANLLNNLKLMVCPSVCFGWYSKYVAN
ncbi:hypothetical protein LXL04_003675 [Taraxacum kok-saghyz]